MLIRKKLRRNDLEHSLITKMSESEQAGGDSAKKWLNHLEKIQRYIEQCIKSYPVTVIWGGNTAYGRSGVSWVLRLHWFYAGAGFSGVGKPSRAGSSHGGFSISLN